MKDINNFDYMYIINFAYKKIIFRCNNIIYDLELNMNIS